MNRFHNPCNTDAVMKGGIPKGPCRYMVYTRGQKGFPYTYFKAQLTWNHDPKPEGTNRGYIGIMEEKTETTTAYWGIGLYWDNGT